MNNAQPSSKAIAEAALKVCSREELVQMSRPRRMTLIGSIADLLEKYPNPTQAQLEGCKEMLEYLYPKAFEGLGGLAKL